MKKRLFAILFLFSICLGSLSAQAFKKQSSKQSSPQEIVPYYNSFPDTLKILAVMVEFAEDKDATTFGNGKFGTIYSPDKNYGNSILDPLPHDKNYFSLHLDFAKNYFRKVSNGKLNLSYNILPGVITLSGIMRNYSPLPNSQDLSPLGKLSKEAWSLALAQNQGLDFSKYDLFIIFHAGVGRDISLPGSIGNERDLPSVYLSDKTLRNIFVSDFSGLPSNRNNQFNSLVIPETESRELSNLGVNSLIQITINGLIVSSIASHLGLPDLFDTKTGKSAIGRFGLMDGQAIFAYNGVFPPEPSAWEKIFLGWEKPVVSNLQEGTVNLTSNTVASAGDTTVFKVPINSDEYFLLENRERDANKNGSVITYVVGGNTFQKTFTNDQTGYYSFDTDSLKGVITDVDEFDWAIPGSGILIWHIDDKIINAKIAADQINADLNNRGVFVEEADGIQDIGQQFTSIFGDNIIGEGDSVDMWYGSNNSKFFRNQFTPQSRPNSNSNSGANSLIYITNFSNKSNKMSFNIRFNNGDIALVNRTKLPFNQKVDVLYSRNPFDANRFLVHLENSDIYRIDSVGNVSAHIPNFSKTITAYSRMVNVGYVIGINGSTVNIWSETHPDSLFTYNVNEPITTIPVTKVRNSDVGTDVNIRTYLGTESGKIIVLDFGTSSLQFTVSKVYQFDPGLFIQQIAVNGPDLDNTPDYVSAIAVKSYKVNPEYYFLDSQNNTIKINSDLKNLVMTQDKNSQYLSILTSGNGDFNIIQNGQIINSYNVGGNFQTGSIAVGDLKNDGNNYLVYNNGNKLEVRGINGAEADNFPFTDPNNIGFTGTPSIALLSGNDNDKTIFAYTKDGRIYAIDAASGKVLNGYPLTIGASLTVNPLVFDSGDIETRLAAVNDSSIFSIWTVNSHSFGATLWVGKYGDYGNKSFAGIPLSKNAITSFFPQERVYNYPNPVYGEETFIRYYVSEDSKINIKIFDLAGDFVAELNNTARGGLDSETKWNIKNIQSGVYLARVEATGNSGSTGYKIIKIAVIK